MKVHLLHYSLPCVVFFGMDFALTAANRIHCPIVPKKTASKFPSTHIPVLLSSKLVTSKVPSKCLCCLHVLHNPKHKFKPNTDRE